MEKANFLNITPLSDHLDEANIDKEVVNDRNLYKIVLVSAGSLCIKIGDQKYLVKASSLYFIAPGQVSQLLEFDAAIDGYCISFDIDYFLLCLKNQVQLCFYPYFQLDKYPILQLTKTQHKKVVELAQGIKIEYENRSTLNDDLLTKLYLNILLIEIERFYKLKPGSKSSEPSRKRLVTSKFKQLVEKNFMTVRKVSSYAGMLSMAPNYLNDMVKETTGQSASEIIQDRVILEAKAQLVQTELTVNEIAYELQFNDSSYFCRFFRKQTGISPQGFRRTNHF